MNEFFDQINTTTSTTLTPKVAILSLLVAFILGLIISYTYMKTNSKNVSFQSFALAMVMIPPIIALIILFVGSSVARAFSLAGAFSIIRFRSTAADPKDISYVLFTMAAGLACGIGLFTYAIALTIILCILMIILCKLNYGQFKSSAKLLKILVPEDLNFKGAFDNTLTEYSTNFSLKRVRTTDLGAIFELFYIVNLKPNVNEKDFIDDLRTRNGNLSITLSLVPEQKDY